jgi:hypothetical protein
MLPCWSISQFCPEIDLPQIQQNWVEATDVEAEDRIAVSVRLEINQFAQETDARHGHGGRMCSVDCLNCRRIVRGSDLPKCAIVTDSHYRVVSGTGSLDRITRFFGMVEVLRTDDCGTGFPVGHERSERQWRRDAE